jgi:hypothetical protein
VNAFNFDWTEENGYANPPWSLIDRVLKKIQREQCITMMVVPDWTRASWYPLFQQMTVTSLLITDPCYWDAAHQLRPKPRWNTRIAILDGSQEFPGEHHSLVGSLMQALSDHKASQKATSAVIQDALHDLRSIPLADPPAGTGPGADNPRGLTDPKLTGIKSKWQRASEKLFGLFGYGQGCSTIPNRSQ